MVGKINKGQSIPPILETGAETLAWDALKTSIHGFGEGSFGDFGPEIPQSFISPKYGYALSPERIAALSYYLDSQHHSSRGHATKDGGELLLAARSRVLSADAIAGVTDAAQDERESLDELRANFYLAAGALYNHVAAGWPGLADENLCRAINARVAAMGVFQRSRGNRDVQKNVIRVSHGRFSDGSFVVPQQPNSASTDRTVVADSPQSEETVSAVEFRPTRPDLHANRAHDVLERELIDGKIKPGTFSRLIREQCGLNPAQARKVVLLAKGLDAFGAMESLLLEIGVRSPQVMERTLNAWLSEKIQYHRWGDREFWKNVSLPVTPELSRAMRLLHAAIEKRADHFGNSAAVWAPLKHLLTSRNNISLHDALVFSDLAVRSGFDPALVFEVFGDLLPNSRNFRFFEGLRPLSTELKSNICRKASALYLEARYERLRRSPGPLHSQGNLHSEVENESTRLDRVVGEFKLYRSSQSAASLPAALKSKEAADLLKGFPVSTEEEADALAIIRLTLYDFALESHPSNSQRREFEAQVRCLIDEIKCRPNQGGGGTGSGEGGAAPSDGNSVPPAGSISGMAASPYESEAAELHAVGAPLGAGTGGPSEQMLISSSMSANISRVGRF